MNLRMIGIGAVVVCSVLLPLVASAGPADGPEPEPARSKGPGDPEAAPGGRGVVRNGGAAGLADAKPSPRARGGGLAGPALRQGGSAVREAAARCGPELVSPEGVEAQTCVLTEGRDAWARTYYRNATGGRLRSVLTLMGPRGHTVQTNCAVSAGDQPGTCETPREPARGKPGAYSAVAEFAEEGDDAPLLLRSGSNAPDGAANSAAASAR
ncbi:hypothetical protein [Streptomyces sp. CBMA152]|uniref:hypothetical protein n=1 Tax=Streptomyces sp. CBMA152 TaxID=1896312 RepID=UPI0016604C4C|nr:hypothetical protein [Streptomyces sp. CBMA152]MBD0745791.1 hypothetical protein [Streptomyces sp. CBMA152]